MWFYKPNKLKEEIALKLFHVKQFKHTKHTIFEVFLKTLAAPKAIVKQGQSPTKAVSIKLNVSRETFLNYKTQKNTKQSIKQKISRKNTSS